MRGLVLLFALVGCAADPGPFRPSGGFAITDARFPGDALPHTVVVREGRIAAIDGDPASLPTFDAAGRWLMPGAIDSHVHLAYRPAAGAMADGGIAVAVDLAAPLEWLATRPTAPRIVAAGPMITAARGYPTQGWGRDGYGREVTTPEEAEAAVSALVAAGAGVIKVPVTDPPTLDEATLAATIAAAHAAGLQVVAHALSEAEAARAAAAGVDGLAHTPVERLSDATVAAWSGGFVISTLGAFGGADATVDNLRRLRAAGAGVLYGTDFGNTTVAGVDARELTLLGAAGLDGRAIADALGPTPARVWGRDDAGSIAVGAPASFVLLAADPWVDPSVWSRPDAVWFAGEAR